MVNQFRSEILSRGQSAAKYWVGHENGECRSIRGDTRLLRRAESQPLELVGSLSELTEPEDQFHPAQKMETVGRLAGGVAHHFNNLLTVISGYTSLLVDESTLATRVRNDLLEINKAAASAARLTRQLLAFSRQQVLAPMALNLNVVVRHAEKMLQPVLGERVHVRVTLDATLGMVLADVDQMEQVIVNLAINARDAMLDGGTLTFETSNADLADLDDLDDESGMKHMAVKADAYVMLAVSDTGSGMDERTRAHIFEPFFTTKEPATGAGLGLAAVYGIIRQSEGFIRVRSEPGRGTTFRIYLPRTPTAALSERSAVARPVDPGE